MAKLTSHRMLVAKRYAKSLFELAESLLIEEANAIDIIQKELQDLQKILETNADFRIFIENSAISVKEQEEVIKEMINQGNLFGSPVKDLLAHFLLLLVGNRRLEILPEIIKSYQEMVLALRKEMIAEIRSGRPLTVSQKEEINALLEKISSCKVHLKEQVDNSLLGGLIIRFGSYEIDASLLNKLSSLKLALKEVV